MEHTKAVRGSRMAAQAHACFLMKEFSHVKVARIYQAGQEATAVVAERKESRKAGEKAAAEFTDFSGFTLIAASIADNRRAGSFDPAFFIARL